MFLIFYDIFNYIMDYKFNYKFQEKDERDYIYKLNDKEVDEFFFLADYKAFLPLVLDQGNLGSCVANAVFAAFYIQSSGNIQLSRLQLYMCTRAIDGSSLISDSGATIRGCMKAISNYGISNESIYPYIIKNFNKLAPSQSFTNLYSLTNFKYTFINQKLLDLQQVLNSSIPIVFGIYIYSSFFSTNASKYGIIPMPNTKKEKLQGGHCIVLIGYDNTKQVFKFLNSWGTSWGDAGYGYLPYAYVLSTSLSSDFCTISF